MQYSPKLKKAMEEIKILQAEQKRDSEKAEADKNTQGADKDIFPGSVPLP